jgi:hypothetical protein
MSAEACPGTAEVTAREAPRVLDALLGPTSRFVSSADPAKNSAKRNEAFRTAGRKSLTSLIVSNQHFAGLFVFKDLPAVSFRAFFARFIPKRQRTRNHGAPLSTLSAS